MSSTLNNALLARFSVNLSAADLRAATGADPDSPEPIDFTPVPRRRNRRGGWCENTQREFIACLQLTGSVAAAARAVGRTPSTAYRLLDAEGADSFAIAWDKAFEEGLNRLRQNSLDRAINGALVPVYRQGRLVRVEHRSNDRLAIALLGNKNRHIDLYRRSALRRHVYKMELQQLDKDRAEAKQRDLDAKKAHDDAVQAMIEKAKAKRVPRVSRI